MNRRLHRLTALILAFTLLFSCVGESVIALAETAELTAEEQLMETVSAQEETATQEDAEVSADEPAAQEPIETPAEKPAETPAETVDEKPSEPVVEKEKPVETPVEKPDEVQAGNPAESPAEKPAEAPAEKTGEQPETVPETAPVEQPVETPAETPAEIPEGGSAEVEPEVEEQPADHPEETAAEGENAFHSGFACVKENHVRFNNGEGDLIALANKDFVVYVVSVNENTGRASVRYTVNREIVTAFVGMDHLVPMTEEESTRWIEKAGEEAVLLKDDKTRPLAEMPAEWLVTEEEKAEEEPAEGEEPSEEAEEPAGDEAQPENDEETTGEEVQPEENGEAVEGETQPEEVEEAVEEEPAEGEEEPEEVEEPILRTLDDPTGVSVTFSSEAIPEGIDPMQVTLRVKKLAADQNVIQEIFEQGLSVVAFCVYDISLIDGATGNEFEPVAMMDVVLPAPDVTNKENLVFHTTDDHVVEQVKSSENENGEIVFGADSFSTYGVYAVQPLATVSASTLPIASAFAVDENSDIFVKLDEAGQIQAGTVVLAADELDLGKVAKVIMEKEFSTGYSLKEFMKGTGKVTALYGAAPNMIIYAKVLSIWGVDIEKSGVGYVPLTFSLKDLTASAKDIQIDVTGPGLFSRRAKQTDTVPSFDYVASDDLAVADRHCDSYNAYFVKNNKPTIRLSLSGSNDGDMHIGYYCREYTTPQTAQIRIPLTYSAGMTLAQAKAASVSLDNNAATMVFSSSVKTYTGTNNVGQFFKTGTGVWNPIQGVHDPVVYGYAASNTASDEKKAEFEALRAAGKLPELPQAAGDYRWDDEIELNPDAEALILSVIPDEEGLGYWYLKEWRPTNSKKTLAGNIEKKLNSTVLYEGIWEYRDGFYEIAPVTPGMSFDIPEADLSLLEQAMPKDVIPVAGSETFEPSKVKVESINSKYGTWNFKGWYADAALQTPAKEASAGEIFYAKWEFELAPDVQLAFVTLNRNLSIGDTNTEKVLLSTLEGEDLIPGNPFEATMIFKGWANAADAVEPDYLPGDAFFTSNEKVIAKTLFAVWEMTTTFEADMLIGDETGHDSILNLISSVTMVEIYTVSDLTPMLDACRYENLTNDANYQFSMTLELNSYYHGSTDAKLSNLVKVTGMPGLTVSVSAPKEIPTTYRTVKISGEWTAAEFKELLQQNKIGPTLKIEMDNVSYNQLSDSGVSTYHRVRAESLSMTMKNGAATRTWNGVQKPEGLDHVLTLPEYAGNNAIQITWENEVDFIGLEGDLQVRKQGTTAYDTEHEAVFKTINGAVLDYVATLDVYPIQNQIKAVFDSEVGKDNRAKAWDYIHLSELTSCFTATLTADEGLVLPSGKDSYKLYGTDCFKIDRVTVNGNKAEIVFDYTGEQANFKHGQRIEETFHALYTHVVDDTQPTLSLVVEGVRVDVAPVLKSKGLTYVNPIERTLHGDVEGFFTSYSTMLASEKEHHGVPNDTTKPFAFTWKMTQNHAMENQGAIAGLAKGEGYDAILGEKPEWQDHVQLTVSIEPEYVDVSVSKKWEDEDNQDGLRPDSVTVQLLADGKAAMYEDGTRVKPVVLSAANQWKAAFTGLPKEIVTEVQGKATMKAIRYTVEEAEVPEYQASVTEPKPDEHGNLTYVLTNTHIPSLTNVTVTKVWQDDKNRDGLRPASVQVNLLANGQETGKTVVLNKANNWKGTFSNLPVNVDGKAVTYTVSEDPVKKYTAKITENKTEDGSVAFTVTNRHEPEKIELAVVKVWEDEENAGETRPESIQVHLFADGVQIETRALTEATQWRTVFTNLYRYDEGEEILYTITEDEVPGYTTVIQGSIITNTLIPKERYTVTVRYWYNEIGSETAAPTFFREYDLGDLYHVVSPKIPGWVADIELVAGTVTGNLEFDVVYTPKKVKLVIDYIYENGETAAPTYEEIFSAGDPYDVVSPVIPGYWTRTQECKGTMPDHDVHLIVIYITQGKYTLIEDNMTPLGIGNIDRNVGDCFE